MLTMVSAHLVTFPAFFKIVIFFQNISLCLLPLAYYIESNKDHVVNFHHLQTQIFP